MLTINFNKPVPLFALGGCVLLPHATIPLHMFEPRYKKLANDVLDSSGLIAVATYKNPRQSDDDPDAPLRPWVCVGYVVRHESLAQGRYLLLVQGICRAEIIKEVDYQPYRTALLRPAIEAGKQISELETELGDQRQNLEDLINDPTLGELANVNALRNWISDEIPTGVVVDLAALTLCSRIDQRYAMLAEPNLSRRVDWLDNYLRQTLKVLQRADAMGPSISEDGLNLN